MRVRALLTTTFLLAAPAAHAQLDPAKRMLLEGGYEDGLGNPGPNGAYAFLYLNRPDVAGKGSALRLAIAPVYLDAELGLPLGERLDAGVGLSGGGYAFSRKEVVRGDQRPGESFIGHGVSPSFSLYPRLGSLGPVPASAVARVFLVRTDYQRTKDTDAAFAVPPDELTGAARLGLRLGGQEPGMGHGPALEASLWYETRVRDRPATYGYGDRSVRRSVNLYWARLLFTAPSEAPRWAFGANAGGADRLGRLDAYRLGGLLTQSAEFPLILPGYFNQEIAAHEYAQAWGRVGVPLDARRRVYVNALAAGAAVTAVRRTDPGGPSHAGFGVSLEFAPRDGAFHCELTYGYSPTALRGGRRGGQSLALAAEIDFMTPDPKARRGAKTRQQGLNWLFGR